MNLPIQFRPKMRARTIKDINGDAIITTLAGKEFFITSIGSNYCQCSGIRDIFEVQNDEFEFIEELIIQLINIKTGEIFTPRWINPEKQQFVYKKGIFSGIRECGQPLLKDIENYGKNSIYQEYNPNLQKSHEKYAIKIRAKIKKALIDIKRFNKSLENLYGIEIV